MKVDLACEQATLDVVDYEKYSALVKKHKITYIVHLAAILSALGEKRPDLARTVNTDGCINALNIARDNNCRIYVPSTIAVFGGDKFPKVMTPDDTILAPTTMYGVTKVFNENLGNYYHMKYNVDFRSIRYPGIISSAKYAFNGTTDYSTEIFFHGLERGKYSCFLEKDTYLPMMYIDDCVDLTVKFLKADQR
mmetsp:Transcript_11510/g.11493  ORF Transcript_11510/g.11493 Transcript_11510/m.11493 type:complete len:193 (-) Transcript_11510:304-882(-)